MKTKNAFNMSARNCVRDRVQVQPVFFKTHAHKRKEIELNRKRRKKKKPTDKKNKASEPSFAEKREQW